MAKTIKKGAGDISPENLKKVSRDYEAAKADKDDASADMSEVLKRAEAVHGLHKAAFKSAFKLKHADPGKRADFLRAFDSYRHILELDDQPDMLDSAPQQAAAVH